MDKIAEIKQRYTIADILRLAGITEFKGNFIRSPLRGAGDKTPSCKIYHNTNSFYDFSAHTGGDMLTLYTLLFNCDITEAVRRLLNDTAPPARRQAETKTTPPDSDLSDLLDTEKTYYDNALAIYNSPARALQFTKLNRMDLVKVVYSAFLDYCRAHPNAAAVNYLERRGFTRDEINAHFVTVGDYAGANDALHAQFSLDRLKLAGIVSDSGRLIFYKHSVIIPYYHYCQPVYLRGRYFDGEAADGKPKYIGLKKDGLGVLTARRLYNTDVLRRMLPGETVYITEGEIDAVAITVMGYNAVGIPGVGNMPRADVMRRLLPFQVVICTDNDEPGNAFRDELTNFFNNDGRQVKYKNLPANAKDANDFLIFSRRAN